MKLLLSLRNLSIVWISHSALSTEYFSSNLFLSFCTDFTSSIHFVAFSAMPYQFDGSSHDVRLINFTNNGTTIKTYSEKASVFQIY